MRSDTVSKDMILPAGATRHHLDSNEVFLAPVPIADTLPDFPVPYRNVDNIDVTICVEVAIAATGEVSSVRQLDNEPGCGTSDGGISAAFYQETERALRTWTYFGAAVCRFALTESECHDGTAEQVAVPVKLAYRLAFRAVDGRRNVSTSRH